MTAWQIYTNMQGNVRPYAHEAFADKSLAENKAEELRQRFPGFTFLVQEITVWFAVKE
jgi:hypothetical protein